MQQKKWYVIDIERKSSYSHHNPTKSLAKSIEVFVIILLHIFWSQEILLLQEQYC